ncbi:MAG: hypothetical protein QNJ44_15640 [Rhodobacter sp.]|nr:hypothetical protein [Rhodobacter sp.]
MKYKELCALGALAVGAATGSVTAADLPSKMIFFVPQESCPDGSAAAQDAAGRILIVTSSTSEVGKTYGTPMKDLQDNSHTHAATMTVNLPSHHIAGASGGGNGQATSKGDHSASYTSGSATTNLPFIQLLVCVAD